MIGLAKALVDPEGDVLAAVSVAVSASRFSPESGGATLGHIERAIASLSRTTR